jgi:hypothetical protein
MGQRDIVTCHALDPGIKPDSHAAPGEHLLRMSSQAFTQFWQDHRARVHEHNSQHIFTQIGVEWQRIPYEVI